MTNRPSCCKCSSLAVWVYVPASERIQEKDRYYCDEHIERGCSCNVIDFDDPNPDADQYRDELGRLLPCCEYAQWVEEEENFMI